MSFFCRNLLKELNEFSIWIVELTEIQNTTQLLAFSDNRNKIVHDTLFFCRSFAERTTTDVVCFFSQLNALFLLLLLVLFLVSGSEMKGMCLYR